MGLLNAFDAIIIICYLIGITWIGSRYYKKDAGLKEYLQGSKVMKWFPVALSIIAADTSAISYLGLPAWSFREDMKLSMGILAYLLAIPIVIKLFLPVFAKGNLFTAYQYLEQRFDLRVRLLACLFFMIVRGTHVAVIIYAPALVIAELMGVPLKFSILVMGVLTAFYTTMGGIRAVIWTDTIQVITVLVGFTVITASVFSHIPGGASEFILTGMAHSKFEFFDFSSRLTKIDNFWALFIGGTLLYTQALSTDQSVLQKFFTTNSAKETRKSLVFYGLVIIPVILLLSFLGVALFVFYTSHPDIKATLKNPDAVVAHYAANMLPHGLTGLIVASIFAGSMSTVSASINSLATSSVVDIYKRLLRPDLTDRHYTKTSRLATILWGLLATVGALFADRLGTLVLATVKIQSLIGGEILGVFLLGVISRTTTSTGALVGAMTGLSVVLVVSLSSPLSLYWFCVIGCFCTLIIGWLYSQFFVQSIAVKEAP
jgi:solute:Na+ symporter, SSS family